MNHFESLEAVEEQVKNAVTVLQLLMAELNANEDDPHIARGVGIAEGMLQVSLQNLQQMKKD